MHNFFWRNTVYGISQWIEKSSRIYLHNQAVKEGLEQGKKRGIEKVARQLKSQGIDSDIIAQATFLSIEEIEKM